jgi:hypothetical protein
MPQVNFNIDAMDDPIVGDGTLSFEGGMVSNQRANLLKENQSSSLINCDIDKFGWIRTRRGVSNMGTPSGTYIQAMATYLYQGNNYVVAAANKGLYQWTGGTSWTQIATGGVPDNATMAIYRTGFTSGVTTYNTGDVTFQCYGVTGTVGAGNGIYFRVPGTGVADFYTIATSVYSAPSTTSITLSFPGFIRTIPPNTPFTVAKPASVNHGGGYGSGATSIAINGYSGVVNTNEHLVFLHQDGVTHSVTGHTETGGNTTNVTISPGITGNYQASSATSMITITQGEDKLYFCDGVGQIASWDGSYTRYEYGSEVLGTVAPVGPSILTWFQSRLIAAGFSDIVDNVWFSDYLDGSTWDSNFQTVRVGGGDGDAITALVGWTDLNLLVFKKNSIWVVNCDPSQNPNPDDPTQIVASFAIKVITRHLGCTARRTAVIVGGGSDSPGSDVFFLATDKTVRSIRRTLAAETQQQLGDPISNEPNGGIQDILNRINVNAMNTSCAGYRNNRYILAVPIDSATQPNVVLVYNTLTQSWCGQWTGWVPSAFINFDDVTLSSLIFGQSTGGVRQWLDDTRVADEVTATYQDAGSNIATTIQSRGMTFGDEFCRKTGLNTELEFEESSATATVTAITDGTAQSDPVVSGLNTGTATVLRLSYDLQRYGPWRELMLSVVSTSGKLRMRSIKITGFYDSLVLQT